MKKIISTICIVIIFFITGCETEDGLKRYTCHSYTEFQSAQGCVEDVDGEYETLEMCENACDPMFPQPNTTGIVVTVFLYENCPIAQYMCGPLRNSYRYFCDTLNQEIIFRGFSPNAFSTPESLSAFIIKYDIPFDVTWDYNQINNEPGSYTQTYLPIVTPEVFIEFNGSLLYRGMIDNSYQALGQWSPPTENYLDNVLMQLINNEQIVYLETEAIGRFINY